MRAVLAHLDDQFAFDQLDTLLIEDAGRFQALAFGASPTFAWRILKGCGHNA
jgi:hypothetical protein